MSVGLAPQVEGCDPAGHSPECKSPKYTGIVCFQVEIMVCTPSGSSALSDSKSTNVPASTTRLWCVYLPPWYAAYHSAMEGASLGAHKLLTTFLGTSPLFWSVLRLGELHALVISLLFMHWWLDRSVVTFWLTPKVSAQSHITTFCYPFNWPHHIECSGHLQTPYQSVLRWVGGFLMTVWHMIFRYPLSETECKLHIVTTEVLWRPDKRQCSLSFWTIADVVETLQRETTATSSM